MAKRTVKPIDLSSPGFGDSLDDVFSNLNVSPEPEEKQSPAPPAESKSTPTPAAKTRAKKPAAAKPKPRKKKVAATPTVDQAPPPGSLSEDDLRWFVENRSQSSDLKPVYLDAATMNALKYVSKAAGIPISNLSTNIVTWFLSQHRTEIKRLVTRKINPLDDLDL